MAIRSLRKKMRPVIWFIVVAFFITAAAGALNSIKQIVNNKQYAFKLNGNKIEITQLERGINNISNQYSEYFTATMDREDAKIMAVDSILTNEILKEIGKDLKVKVSGSEVDVKMDAIEAQIPDKDQFKRMLAAQGYTKKSFENSIKDSILVEKTRDKIVENTKVSEEETVAQYEKDKYSEYLGKTYDEAKPLIEKKLKEENGEKELIKLIEAGKKIAKIDDIRENYGNVLPTLEFEENGFNITNVDVVKGSLYQSFYGVKDYNEAKVKSGNKIKEEIKVAKIALERGAEKDETLPTMNQIMDLKLQLADKIKENITINDSEIKKFFNENKEAYDVEASVDANIINFVVNPTDLDTEEAKEKANKILGEVNASNFYDMAKKYSEGPSASKGGDLGWFGKGQMIPEFETAAFKCEVGKVYSKVVKSKFGYHIIYVENKHLEEISDSLEATKYMDNKITYDESGTGFDDIYNDLKDSEEVKMLLKSVVQELPEDQKNVITLKFWKNFNDDEIGYELNFSRKKVRSLLEKSFSYLRERILSEMYETVDEIA